MIPAFTVAKFVETSEVAEHRSFRRASLRGDADDCETRFANRRTEWGGATGAIALQLKASFNQTGVHEH